MNNLFVNTRIETIQNKSENAKKINRKKFILICVFITVDDAEIIFCRRLFVHDTHSTRIHLRPFIISFDVF